MLKLILLRHGNTFAPGETAVMVGAHQDLPLVARGLEQAHECAAALRESNVSPSQIYCSPLARTRQFANILTSTLGIQSAPLEVEALREVDFGEWTGLSDAQVKERFGADALRKWRDGTEWPAVFRQSQAEIHGRWEQWLDRLLAEWPDGSVLGLVTSAGVLRALLEKDPGAFEERRRNGQLGFKTGHLGVAEHSKRGTRIGAWDIPPSEFAKKGTGYFSPGTPFAFVEK